MSIKTDNQTVIDQLAASSDLIDRVTTDSAQVTPPSGRVHVFLGSPSITWPNWNTHLCAYDAWIVAGTVSSQREALDLIYQALQDIEDKQLVDVIDAEPAGWTRNGSKLAAYRITINKEE